MITLGPKIHDFLSCPEQYNLCLRGSVLDAEKKVFLISRLKRWLLPSYGFCHILRELGSRGVQDADSGEQLLKGLNGKMECYLFRHTRQVVEVGKLIRGVLDKLIKVSEQDCLFTQRLETRLKTFPIVCRITRAANEKLQKLRENYECHEFDTSIVLGMDDRDGSAFAPRGLVGVHLARISKYFLHGRLAGIHLDEGRPEDTTEPVAPVISVQDGGLCSIDDYKKLKCLRGDKSIDSLLFERKVAKIRPGDIKAGTCLNKALQIWLVMDWGWCNQKTCKFDMIESRYRLGNYLKLSIDYQNEDWKLQAQLNGTI